MADIHEIGIRPLRRTMIVFDASEDVSNIEKCPMVVELVNTFYFKLDAGKIIINQCDTTLSGPCDA